MPPDIPSILIIDDDDDVAEVVRAVLADEGYHAVTLRDITPDSVATVVGRLEPDAVLLDGESQSAGYGRSWDDAASLAERIRPVPVIMFSAHSHDIHEAREARTDRSRRAQFAAIIGKPFDVDELLRAVETAVARGSARRRDA